MKTVRGRKVREEEVFRLWDDVQVRRNILLGRMGSLFPQNTWWEVYLSSKRKTPTVMMVIGYEVHSYLRVRFWMDRRTSGGRYRGRQPYFCKSVSIEQIGNRAAAVESGVAA